MPYRIGRAIRPLVRNLPKFMLLLYFPDVMADDDVFICQNEIIDTMCREDLPDDKMQALILLLWLYPKETSKCIAFANDVLKTTAQELFEISACLGRLDILEVMLRGDEPSSGPYLSPTQEHIRAIFEEHDYFFLKEVMVPDVKNTKLLLGLVRGEKSPAYQGIVKPFIQQYLISLHQEQASYCASNSGAVFDFQGKKRAEDCLLILRNLIQRNEKTLDNELKFLLNIPSVKALAHTPVTSDKPNELLRVAMAAGNKTAADMLLNIHSVRELATQKGFYRFGWDGDFSQLLQDNELIVSGLSEQELQHLDPAIQHYKSIMKEKSILGIMQELRDALKLRYENHPLIFTTSDNKQINLPLDYPDLMALKLSEDDLGKAKRAYYQDLNHSAWRYLLKPNPWIDDKAKMKETDASNSQHWSKFETFQSLIALIYLCASDVKMKAIDGNSHKERMDSFVLELALMGRSYNRLTATFYNGKLKPCPDDEDDVDDLRADNPICPALGKKGLLQSVIAHPLFTVEGLTQDDIRSELRVFLLNHIKAIITQDNVGVLKDAYQQYICELDEDAAKQFQCLNLPDNKQKEFYSYLQNTYREKFTLDLQLYIKAELSLKTEGGISERYHAFKFDGLVKLREYLETVYQNSLVNRQDKGAPTLVEGPSPSSEPVAATQGGRPIREKDEEQIQVGLQVKGDQDKPANEGSASVLPSTAEQPILTVGSGKSLTSNDSGQTQLPPLSSEPQAQPPANKGSAASVVFFKPGNSDLEKISNLIRILKKEKTHPWIYRNFARKDVKIEALEKLLVKIKEKVDPLEAVVDIISDYADRGLLKGRISHRCLNLFNELSQHKLKPLVTQKKYSSAKTLSDALREELKQEKKPMQPD